MSEAAFLLLLAGICQGSFVAPMSKVRDWRWEHTWLSFSFLGMLLFNWCVSLVAIPSTFSILSAVPLPALLVVAAFGAGWGLGAVLFGIGMDRLGLALGYPIIMGLVSAGGSLLPILILQPAELFTPRGAMLAFAICVVIVGIVLCARGASARESGAGVSRTSSAILLAVAAGILSCLPNVGAALSSPIAVAASAHGVSSGAAKNLVWVVFFTAGGIVNCAYCVQRIAAGSSWRQFTQGIITNWRYPALMAAAWIASFYLFGFGIGALGTFGAALGWMVFMSLSIVCGFLWGIARGEWSGSPRRARVLRDCGLAVLLAAVILVAISQTL